MKPEDVTEEWVRNNYDLNEQRKNIKHEKRLDCYHPFNGQLLDIYTHLREEADEWIRKHHIPDEATENWSIYSYNGEEPDIECTFIWLVGEADQAIIQRLMKSKKSFIKNKGNRERRAAKKAKAKKDADLKELARLEKIYRTGSKIG